MLSDHDLSATFYVPIHGENGRAVLETAALHGLLQRGFEIGAHTMSHRMLPQLSEAELLAEVRGSKEELENRFGQPIRTFCYPRGRYDAKVIECVRRCGFQGARTTRMLATSPNFERFEMPTSLQAYPHRPIHYLKNLGKRRDWLGLGRYARNYFSCHNWVTAGKKLFDEVLHKGGIWHLYGHSWELDELRLWDQLQELFDYVAKRPGVLYASNREVLDLKMATPTDRIP